MLSKILFLVLASLNSFATNLPVGNKPGNPAYVIILNGTVATAPQNIMGTVAVSQVGGTTSVNVVNQLGTLAISNYNGTVAVSNLMPSYGTIVISRTEGTAAVSISGTANVNLTNSSINVNVLNTQSTIGVLGLVYTRGTQNIAGILFTRGTQNIEGLVYNRGTTDIAGTVTTQVAGGTLATNVLGTASVAVTNQLGTVATNILGTASVAITNQLGTISTNALGTTAVSVANGTLGITGGTLGFVQAGTFGVSLLPNGTITAISPPLVSSALGVNVTTSSTQISAANAKRMSISCTNTSNQRIQFNHGAAATLTTGETVYSQGSFFMEQSSYGTLALNAIATAGTANLVTCLEWSLP